VLLAGLGLLPRRLVNHVLFLLNTHPQLADTWGYHVRPIHYYEPLPDVRTINDEMANRRRVPAAVDFDVDAQRQLVRRLGASYGSELVELAATRQFDFANEYFSGLDAAVYYAVLRDLRPRRVIEIGAGMSTRIADRALQRNRGEGHDSELTCIEPYPQPRLTEQMPDAILIERPVEQVPLDTFDALQANDVLFIDSSHAVRFGGDVCREFLEILPRLNAGVWIHVHDIFFPFDYPATWVIDQRLAFAEQYLLEAFLSFNRQFEVKAVNAWLAREHRDDARSLAPDAIWPAGEHGCSSFWMQRVA
jgi:hypothetical protein